jgi:hypothetical protein
MCKNDRILLLLGRLQARIEDLGLWASETKNPVFYFLSDLENYFNTSLHDIFSSEEHERSIFRKGITWKTLPR